MARAKKTYKGEDKTSFPAILGKILDGELLNRKDETQEKLAAAIGVKRQTVSQWRYGNTFPDVIQLAGIADYFDVSTDFLLGRTDEPSPRIEDKAIYDKTGLSPRAIQILEIIKDDGKKKSSERLLNNIIESSCFLGIVDSIRQCLVRMAILENMQMEAKKIPLREQIKSSKGEGIALQKARSKELLKAQEVIMRNGQFAVEAHQAPGFYLWQAQDLLGQLIKQLEADKSGERILKGLLTMEEKENE